MAESRDDALQCVIVVCSYRRPEKLKALLPLLYQQAVSSTSRVRILVVDNDPGGSAESVTRSMPFPVDYTLERRTGIGWARNRALDSARAEEWVVFFDDDQTPGPRWFAALSTFAERSTGTTIGVGPVTPRFASEHPQWGDGWAWGAHRANYADGADRKTAGFGNVIIPPGLVSASAFRVEGVFLKGPGEDTLLSVRARALHYGIRYVSDATASEEVDVERLSPTWVVRRAFLDGRTWGRIAKIGGFSAQVRAVGSIGKAALRGVSAFWNSSALRLDGRIVRMRTEFALALGIAVGVSTRRAGIFGDDEGNVLA